MVMSILPPRKRDLKRRSRDSVVPDELKPPYNIERHFYTYDGLIHATGLPESASEFSTCCRIRFAGAKRVDAETPTCLQCVLCLGCFACREGHVIEATMRLGKWETKDKRKLYVFEMDNTHLVNALNKIRRDQEDFKPNWAEWVEVLEAEVKQRRL